MAAVMAGVVLAQISGAIYDLLLVERSLGKSGVPVSAFDFGVA
jgi:hypothetical protein